MSKPTRSPGVESGSKLSTTLSSTRGQHESSAQMTADNEQMSKRDRQCDTAGETTTSLTKTSASDQHMMGAPGHNCSDSPEVMEVQTVDGRVITVANTVTQTDWDWLVRRQQKDSSSVHLVVEDLVETPAEELTADLRGLVIAPDFENVEEMERQQEKKLYGIPDVGPPSLLAYRPESKQPPVLYKSPAVLRLRQPEMSTDSILCDYCHQPSESFISRAQLENTPESEPRFCCERAQAVRMLILEEERALADLELDKKIDVGPHAPFMSKHQKRAAKERAEQRLREFEIQRVQTLGNQKCFFSGGQQIKTISYRLSNGDWTIREEPAFHQVDPETGDFFSVQGAAPVTYTKKVLVRSYPDAGPFLTVFPDGTGNVFYPSGCIAISISSVGGGDFTYTVLEDSPSQPNILAIFTSRGHSTCYHPNGLIWVNLTQLEGLQCSEAGALRQRWSWHDLEPHIHPLPFQPLYLSLNPFISLRILTQERIHLTFSHCTCRVRFNVGAKLKLTYPEGLALPGPDTLQKHLQIKCLEIYSLLDRIQTHIAYQHMPSHQNIKPLYGLIAQMERLRRQVDRQTPPRKLKTPVPPKEA
ncbi:glutamate-rich protein 6-like [Sardina pilchardus]|uniref:glutamate-rich protein 6-like n=1 Tax=Sardina pilchardus TaxID=27697 RepID=UPI002E148342